MAESENGVERTPTSVELRAREIVAALAPYLQSDRAAVRFDRLEKRVVHVEISMDPPPDATLVMLMRLGIERKIVEQLPEVERVELV